MEGEPSVQAEGKRARLAPAINLAGVPRGAKRRSKSCGSTMAELDVRSRGGASDERVEDGTQQARALMKTSRRLRKRLRLRLPPWGALWGWNRPLGWWSRGGESTFIDQEQPKTAHDPGTPKRGPQAGSNPFSYAQFTVQPRGSVQYPTSSQ